MFHLMNMSQLVISQLVKAEKEYINSFNHINNSHNINVGQVELNYGSRR